MSTIAQQKQIKDALDAGQYVEALQLARAAFADEPLDEFLAAWTANAIYEHNIDQGFDLLEAFIKKFPQSLHLPHVYLADIFACSELYEAASEYARYYLRQVKERAWLLNPIIQDGLSRSFLLLTCVYTQLGARSYSQRVLHRAFGHKLTDAGRQAIQAELARLQEEMRLPENQALDDAWETFFELGHGATELHQMCMQRDCPMMARRIELLEANFRDNSAFKVDANEMFLLVFESDEQTALLN